MCVCHFVHHWFSFQHPCLLPVHDVGYKDGYVSILRPFVQKGSIRDYLFMVNGRN